MNIDFSNIQSLSKPFDKSQALVFLIREDLELTKLQSKLDSESGGIAAVVLKNKENFAAKFGQTKTITLADNGDLKYIILLGLGSDKDLENYKFEELGGKIFSHSCCFKFKHATVIVDSEIKGHTRADIASSIAIGARLASYKFDKYFTKQKTEEKTTLETLNLALEDSSSASNLYNSRKSVVEGVFLARDCITEPPNKLYPESYAEIISSELENLDVKVEVFGEHEMRNLGMGALLGVGQGSTNESKLVVMQYYGTDKNEAPLAFVGKGITFDTGGVSIKPANGMEDMKYDMAGSAAVVGLMKTLALRGAKVNAIGVVALAENMVGGNAQRPSDVVSTMSGQTIEVLNTDAEGRLVLADALWYTQDKFKPQVIVDLATLTGAITIALGATYAGCFSNNDDLAEKLTNAGLRVNEKLWRMPLHKDYDDMIKSDIADMANLGCVRGAASSSTAAQLLQRFVNNVPWAHLDIAGMAWEKKGKAICPKGAVGFGVRLLNQFVKDYYEQTE